MALLTMNRKNGHFDSSTIDKCNLTQKVTSKSHHNHHIIRSPSLSLFTFSICLILIISPPFSSCLEYEEQFLEQLPLQSIVSTGTHTELYTGEEFTRTCFTKINYKQMCAEFGPMCEFKFEWSYPESLIELTKKGFDPRIRVQNDLPVRLKINPDYEVYASHLAVANIGFSHQGIWSCNFKFINQDNGKLDSWQHNFNIAIVENGVRDSPCLTNDHCSSFNCSNESCICDKNEPILAKGVCIKAPRLGETCSSNADCEFEIEDARCWCSEVASTSSDEEAKCLGRKTCQCPPSYVAVNLGLGRYRCLKKARINEHCYRSQQCEAIDENTYCSFKNRCSCRSGRTCSTPSIRICSSKSDCNSTNEYCGNGRCQVVKDLHERCSSAEECEINAICSPQSNECVCAKGYKISPIKMVCIPENFCSNDLDCEHGFCDTERTTCVAGVPLKGRCSTTKQCRAYDNNSYCDGDTDQCICGPEYYISSQGVCLLNGKCRVNADCQEDQNGRCFYEECIYTKRLGSPCKESRQCYLQTSYSFCKTKNVGQAECYCLNGRENDDQGDSHDYDYDQNVDSVKCKKWRNCDSTKDCKSIINSHCDQSKSVCSCNPGHTLNVDGYCYKKSLSPEKNKDSFWIKLWNQYYIYIIIGASLTGFIISLFICCCCKCLCGHSGSQTSDPNNQTSRRRRDYSEKTREGFDRPVTGVYMPYQPSAPPPPYQAQPPSTISRNF